MRTASPEIFIAREIPVRDGVIVANRQKRGAYGMQPEEGPLAQWQRAEDKRRGGPDKYTDDDWNAMDDDERQHMLRRWHARHRPEDGTWNAMTDDERHEYGREHVEGYFAMGDEEREDEARRHFHSALDSPDYVQREFEDWLMKQGDSLMALRRSPRELQNKLDEFLSQRGAGDPADEILQYVAFLKGAPFAGYEDFDDCTSRNSEKDRPDAYCGEIKHRTEDKEGARLGYSDQTQFQRDFAGDLNTGEPLDEQQLRFINWMNRWNDMRDNAKGRYDGPRTLAADNNDKPWHTHDPRIPGRSRGLDWEHRGMDDDQLGGAEIRHKKDAAVNLRRWLQETMRGEWLPKYERTPDSIGTFWDALGNHPDAAAEAPLKAAAMPTIMPRWHGKTPGGPQGPGVEGLKQKTRYRDVSTPQLRALHKRMMTAPAAGVDINELLRELSFREVLGALHDLSSPGGTPATDGKRTKRTDPNMSAADDWHHRDRGGRWTRGDGHVKVPA